MTPEANILLTGSTGFVGRAVLQKLLRKKLYKVSVALRALNGFDLCNAFVMGEFSKATDWSAALHNQLVVIHAAALSHFNKARFSNPLSEYRRVNVEATLNLARQAALAGVKRFVYISSIKVNGESTLCDRPFRATDLPCPKDDYGMSKYEAEIGLLKLAKQSDMEVVIIRPPLVYGPTVKANFASIVSLIKIGIPLPFGAIKNKRSFIALDNLVDFILLCADRVKSPKAANQVFLLSDGEDISTSLLLRKVARAYGVKTCLFPVPSFLMLLTTALLGKMDIYKRLYGNLQIDSSKARDLLGWKPIISMDDQLEKMAEIDIKKKKL